jgi:hypothetical protein
MKKQELIKHIEDLPYKEGPIVDKIDISRKGLLELVKQLDEPKKVVVPQFVADVIEGVREKSLELEDALHYTWGKGTKEFTEWYKKKSNRDLFARAFLDGYEVEEEKRYIVKMKGLNEYNNYLNYDSIDDEWYFADAENGPAVGTHHTRKQLEETGFGWVFDCPGIEIEEVTG